MEYLPPAPGFLPKWLLIVGFVAASNAMSCWTTPTVTQARIYTKTPVSPLASRLMGTWNFTSAVIRVYGAYYITSKPIYEVTMASFLIAFGSFLSEILIGTASVRSFGAVSPLFVSSISFLWMYVEYGNYIK
ncbi:ergosterol biosynthesis protein Erg28 [Gonapodya prolifera JEL478]|uniref:Ergosterol biosynthesis protein Erg28 n=1 Tax=Gonapodya prolifera (strain JEL478) TaxID=1344416 RepID=A0A139A454_GONPJ|nr:ergosterol biosynthesis protein Erg28 [Gonapodya prolifera JEL478]|eukprot:KXS11494.1 ergosterol biosynthesis protein Erg28 [Gonapodya prolifera JEL478]